MQSTVPVCNVIYLYVKRPINWTQFVAHIKTRSVSVHAWLIKICNMHPNMLRKLLNALYPTGKANDAPQTTGQTRGRPEGAWATWKTWWPLQNIFLRGFKKAWKSPPPEIVMNWWLLYRCFIAICKCYCVLKLQCKKFLLAKIWLLEGPQGCLKKFYRLAIARHSRPPRPLPQTS